MVRNNVILCVCVDKLSKMAHSILTTTHNTSERTVRLFHDHVYKFLGISKVIPSDMDVRFTGNVCYVHHIFKPIDKQNG